MLAIYQKMETVRPRGWLRTAIVKCVTDVTGLGVTCLPGLYRF